MPMVVDAGHWGQVRNLRTNRKALGTVWKGRRALGTAGISGSCIASRHPFHPGRRDRGCASEGRASSVLLRFRSTGSEAGATVQKQAGTRQGCCVSIRLNATGARRRCMRFSPSGYGLRLRMELWIRSGVGEQCLRLGAGLLGSGTSRWSFSYPLATHRHEAGGRGAWVPSGGRLAARRGGEPRRMPRLSDKRETAAGACASRPRVMVSDSVWNGGSDLELGSSASGWAPDYLVQERAGGVSLTRSRPVGMRRCPQVAGVRRAGAESLGGCRG
jgi:hypothetical protein